MAHAVRAEVRLYNNLFQSEEPPGGDDFLSDLDPNSLEILSDVWLEPGLSSLQAGQTVQFERLGYFCRDQNSSLVINRTLGLRDSWLKIKGKG